MFGLVPGVAGRVLAAAAGAISAQTGYYAATGQCLKVKVGPTSRYPYVGVTGIGGYKGGYCK